MSIINFSFPPQALGLTVTVYRNDVVHSTGTLTDDVTDGDFLVYSVVGSEISDVPSTRYVAEVSSSLLGTLQTQGVLDLRATVLNQPGASETATGDGPPTDDPETLTPGDEYKDITNGARYIVINVDDTHEWALLGGEIDGVNDVQGVILGNGIVLVGKPVTGPQVLITDIDAYNDSGNGIRWDGTGVDGEQSFLVRVGPVGEHVNAFTVYADGGAEFAKDVYFDAGVSATTAVSVKGAAAPADGDIQSGQVFMYFDSTDGAAKIRFKGKSADGTVVAGNLALS